jgi:hypothetical protein
MACLGKNPQQDFGERANKNRLSTQLYWRNWICLKGVLHLDLALLGGPFRGADFNFNGFLPGNSAWDKP